MYKLYTVIQPDVKQLRRNVSSVCKDFPIQFLGHDLPNLWITVVNIRSIETECYDSSSVITQQVKLESVTPFHCAFAIGSHSIEHLVGITSCIVQYRYHGSAIIIYTHTSSECPMSEKENRFEEYALFQFYKSVI